jgi:secreted Zn-dependent insulinase-like peptidase
MGSGINLREEILEMYMRNYHGGAMRLVIIGGGGLQSFLLKRYFNYKSYP